MKLGNMARAVISAGAISLLTAQSAKAQEPQDLETRVGRSHQTALMQPKRSEAQDFKRLFFELYEKIRKSEFDFLQSSGTPAISFRDQIYGTIEPDINQLLIGYGINLSVDEPFFNGWVFSSNNRFVVNVVDAAKYRASMTFRSDGSLEISYANTATIPNMKFYFAKLKLTKTEPKPLSLVISDSGETGKEYHYFDKTDFDGAYKILRDLTQEYGLTDRRKDYRKYGFIEQQIMDVRDYLLNIHNIPHERYVEGAELDSIRAAAGRILIPVRGYNLNEPHYTLVISPNRNPAVTIYNRDGTFKTRPLPQVMIGSVR